MQSYNNLHLNHLCQILFRNGKIKNEEHFSNIKDNDNNLQEQRNPEINVGFSKEVLEKVHFNTKELNEKYKIENVMKIWNEIFSSENGDNEIQFMEFSYLKKIECFNENFIKTITLPDNFKMKYSYLNEKIDEDTNNNTNQYMTIWIDFLKILSLHLSSTVSFSNDKKTLEIFKEKSELNNDNIPIPLFSPPNNDYTLHYTNIEKNIDHQWSIFGQEFTNKIELILNILKAPSSEQYSFKYFNNENENKTNTYNNNYTQNKIQIALTLLTSLFERFLGDVLYTQILNEAKIPFLFKDLIVQPELIQLWQKNKSNLGNENDNDNNDDDANDKNESNSCYIDPLTLTLILLFGGPNYLNIRNLLWHGFVILSPSSTITTMDDIDDPFPIHHYFQLTWAIFTIVFNRIKKSLELQHPQKQLKDGSDIVFNRSFSNTLSNSQFDFNFDYKLLLQNEKIIHDLIDKSCFPIDESKLLWHEAFHHYFKMIKSSINSKDYDILIFLTTILPLFEHSLRCLYVAMNQLKEIRFLTANTYEYYIIIDTIFNEYLLIDDTADGANQILQEDENGLSNVKNIMGLSLLSNLKRNQITQLFKPSYIMAIYDLFILQQGIRIRDKLSHGDFQLNQLYQNYEKPSHLLVLIIIDLLSYFQYNDNDKNSDAITKTDNELNQCSNNDNDEQSTVDFNSSIKNYLENYETHFHPKTFILKNTQKLFLDLYSNYNCYQQLILQNNQFFPEEDAIQELEEENPKLMTPSSIALLLPKQQDDQQKEVNSLNNPKDIYEIFQPSFFYKQLTQKNFSNTILLRLHKTITPRLYGTPAQIRFYNACSRIVGLCSSKILNSFQESTTNLIQSCLKEASTQSFDIKNTIELFEKAMNSIIFENKTNPSKNSVNEENNDIYKIDGNVNITTRRRKKLKELPGYLKEIIECSLYCSLIIIWFVDHEYDFFSESDNSSSSNDKDPDDHSSNVSLNEKSEQTKEKESPMAQRQKKLFKIIYKLEVFCERISAYIEKGTLNTIKKEYQNITKDVNRFLSTLNK